MDRRSFLKSGVGTIGALHLAGGRFSPVFAGPTVAGSRAFASKGNGRVLVVVRLDGGNDGLNTVLPLDRYDALAKARANILIPESKALRLDATTGLHPAMTGLHKAFQDGNLGIVQAVGYPNHNQSHFRSTDIWFTGSDSNQVLESGVLGRYLDGRYPGFPVGYPNPLQPHPPAIQIGSTLLTLLQGKDAGMGMAVSDPAKMYSLQPDGIDTAPSTPAGHELEFIRQMASQTQLYGEAVKAAMANAANKSDLYPATGNRLSDQLKAVARLIAGGLETSVYVVSIGGFDTHSDQVQQSDTTIGKHADLLRQLSEAVTAFLDDLRLLGLEERVVGLTMSEFGRRILSNASYGTDHGTAAPLFVFGKPVKGGIVGASPEIPTTTTARDNVPMQFDFRSVYAGLLADWIQIDAPETERVLLRKFDSLDLLEGRFAYHAPVRVGFRMDPVVRNPSTRGVALAYSLDESASVSIDIFDLRGRTVRTLVRGWVPAGRHSTEFDTNGLGTGHYVIGMRIGDDAHQQGFDLVR